jgi:apolipoprotein D and lipocalin family protein
VKTITGRATVVPGSGNARLKVSFFGPFAGDYWIIGLDEKNYSWALVGHPSRRFLWILSRQPTMPESLYRQIVSIAVGKGYAADRIMRPSSLVSP